MAAWQFQAKGNAAEIAHSQSQRFLFRKPTLMKRLTRRNVLAASAAGILGTQIVSASAKNDAPAFRVHEIRTISLQQDRYHGWPTLVRRSNGELLVVCSGGRDSHVCPFGRVELIRSVDDGFTWTYARTILDGPLDDRDAGLLETAKGTLLATTFTSLAYVPGLEKARKAAMAGTPSMSSHNLARWESAHRRLNDGDREKALGTWMIRSEDGGTNWSPAYRVPVNSPHGPTNLSDGRLLYAGISLWTENRPVRVFTSADDGRTWQKTGDIPARPGDDLMQYHELHAVEAQDGRIIVHIRNHNSKNSRETLQTHSTDGGKTWATPYSIGVWGLPSHLLRLSDNRLLMSYGHRRSPLGNQVRVSEDNAASWSDAMLIHKDAASGDLGYPSTAEIAPGKLVTVWYEKLSDNPMAQIRMARWELTS